MDLLQVAMCDTFLLESRPAFATSKHGLRQMNVDVAENAACLYSPFAAEERSKLSVALLTFNRAFFIVVRKYAVALFRDRARQFSA